PSEVLAERQGRRQAGLCLAGPIQVQPADRAEIMGPEVSGSLAQRVPEGPEGALEVAVPVVVIADQEGVGGPAWRDTRGLGPGRVGRFLSTTPPETFGPPEEVGPARAAQRASEVEIPQGPVVELVAVAHWPPRLRAGFDVGENQQEPLALFDQPAALILGV